MTIRRAMSEPSPDVPVPFGFKMSWLAVRSSDGLAIASALGFAQLERASWAQGIEAAYAGGVFITPPINGWTLVAGESVAPDVEQSDGGWRSRLIDLSRRFGEVQMFASHRVVELHAWARARSGVLERAYCYIGESGEVPYDDGERTNAERDLGFSFGDSDGADANGGSHGERDDQFPDEDSVMALAAKWSVSPVELSEQSSPPGLGLLQARRRRPWWRFW
ncbi:MAG: hypothetical protein FJX72_15520 [Armatimonadetes bacterium]|nr:hypothetical protein [Armatimonadota bacterium]